MKSPAVSINQVHLVGFGLIETVTHDHHSCAGGVDGRPLVEQVRYRPDVVAHDGRSMTLPDGNHRIIVFLGPFLELCPWLVLLNGEVVTKEWQGERARRHLSTETEDSDIVDENPENRDSDGANE